MIERHEYISPRKVARDFSEWASLYRGDHFVKVVVYVDESGIHDQTGVTPGTEVATVAGFASPRDNWIEFCDKWQKVLNKYKAACFHHSQWSYALSCALHGWDASVQTRRYIENPYYFWNIDDLREFRLELARIAGEGNKLTVCKALNAQGYHAYKTNFPAQFPDAVNPYELNCINGFFESLIDEMKLRWPHFKEKNGVSIFFDRPATQVWKTAIDAVFTHFKSNNPVLKTYTFDDKISSLPLQAADMLAYRCRELSIEYAANHAVPQLTSDFDKLLFRYLHGPKRSRRIKHV